MLIVVGAAAAEETDPRGEREKLKDNIKKGDNDAGWNKKKTNEKIFEKHSSKLDT